MNATSSNAFDLTDRIVLLTGATRGLGFEMARLLAQAGAHVVINGRDPGRTEEAAARVAPVSSTIRSVRSNAFDDVAFIAVLAPQIPGNVMWINS
jgi:gluconate 5-dehydrogenase